MLNPKDSKPLVDITRKFWAVGKKWSVMSNLEWSELDQAAVDTARVLAADAVEKVGNGHPGTCLLYTSPSPRDS